MSRGVKNLILNVALIALVWSFARVTAQKPDPAGELTVEEKRDFELLNLKVQLTEATKTVSALQAAVGQCQAQLGPLQYDRNQQALQAEQKGIIEKYEKAHPGWTIDPQSGKTVKKTEPPPSPPPPKR